jgi:hypothetical protein
MGKKHIPKKGENSKGVLKINFAPVTLEFEKEHIVKSQAVAMIKHYQTYDPLKEDKTNFVDINFQEIYDYLRDADARAKAEQAVLNGLRIYFARYPKVWASDPTKANKLTVVLVVTAKGGYDYYDDTDSRYQPMNLGSLCPPPSGDCSGRGATLHEEAMKP